MSGKAGFARRAWRLVTAAPVWRPERRRLGCRRFRAACRHRRSIDSVGFDAVDFDSVLAIRAGLENRLCPLRRPPGAGWTLYDTAGRNLADLDSCGGPRPASCNKEPGFETCFVDMPRPDYIRNCSGRLMPVYLASLNALATLSSQKRFLMSEPLWL